MNCAEPSSLDAAALEAAAASAIVADPNVDPRTAAIHLQRAWEALGRALGQSGDSHQWIAAAPLPGLRPERRTALADEVRTFQCFIDAAPESLVIPPPAGQARNLMRHADDLRRVCAALRPAPGAGTIARRGAGWLLRALHWGGPALALLLVAVRPWEADAVGPWRATYYASQHFDGKPILRRYANIDFHWGPDAPHDVVPGDWFSAYFDTCLTIDEETEVAFQVVSDDGARVFLDGKRIIDNWGKHALKSRGAKVRVKPGTHHLRIKYFEDVLDAELHFMASFDPDQPPAQIPVGMLGYPSGAVDDPDPCGRE